MPKRRRDARSIADTLALNVKAYRQLRGLDQAGLAERMSGPFRHPWHQSTVSAVERGTRSVTVPELLALTVALGATAEQLLDPRGPERRTGPALALSRDDDYLADPAVVAGLLSSGVIGAKVTWRGIHPHIYAAELEGEPEWRSPSRGTASRSGS